MVNMQTQDSGGEQEDRDSRSFFFKQKTKQNKKLKIVDIKEYFV